MKFDDMGPGPLPAAPARETEHDGASRNDSGSDRRSAVVRAEPVPAGVVHPDIIEAAIRMLADQGYRVFHARDLKFIEASYSVRPGMLTHPDFDQFIRDRVLQELSINVAMSPAVRWRVKDGPWGRLHEAKMLVVLPQETEIEP